MLTTISCHENNLLDFSREQYPGVHRDLWPHFEAFEREGALRGLRIDLMASSITADIEALHEDNVAGICSYRFNSPGHIRIDQNFWQRAGQSAREMIVFHELGHCFLKRGHQDEAFSSGYCISIMRSGTCCCRDAYTSENRNYYLDELFEQARPQ